MSRLTMPLCIIVAISCVSAGKISFSQRSIDGRHRRSLSWRSPSLDEPRARVERALIASRVVDSQGNTVRLRPTGDAITRRIVYPSVTSQKSVTSQQNRRVSLREKSSRKLRPNNQRNLHQGRPAVQQPFPQGRVVSSRKRVSSSRGRGSSLSRFGGAPQKTNVAVTSSRTPATTTTDLSHNQHYNPGFLPHLSLNAQNETFFHYRQSGPQSYLHRTKNLATVYSDRAGDCPKLPSTNCPPLNQAPRSRSCANDYQCAGDKRCCYHPCLTVNSCVDPVH